MGEAELDVADEVGVGNGLVGVALHPVDNGRVVRVADLSRALADVVAGGEELVVAVGEDPEGVARERGAAVHHAAGLGEQRGAVVVDDLVRDGLLGRRVDAVRVDNGPGAARLVAVVAHALARRLEQRRLGQEGVAVHVLRVADGVVRGHGVLLDHAVAGPVNGRVHAQGKDVLVVVRVDAAGDFGAVRRGRLGRVQAVRVEHTGQLDLELVGAVEGKDVVKGVFVVGRGDDLRDNQAPVTGRDHGAVAVVRVLVQQTIVLLVDANGILDDGGKTVGCREHSIQILDDALAVTTEFETVCHQTSAVLSDIKGVLLLVRRLISTC